MQQHTVIVICGPTAVGKTSLSIQLANRLHTEIISVDSRQCFKELNIGVAKPSQEELTLIRHHFINSHSIHTEVNAVIFEKYALQAAEKIFNNNSTAIMVGGTGLYIKTFCEGLDDMPDIDPFIREQVKRDYEQNGLTYLQDQLSKKDPDAWNTAEQQNPQRLMRALEIVLSTGKSGTNFRKGKKAERPFNIIKIGLELPRDQLYKQINARVESMIEQGLVEEVHSLLPERNLNALQTVGYREIFDYLQGNISLDQAVINIKTNTRHYAKRQLTWFKKDPVITWFNPADEGSIHAAINHFLNASFTTSS